MTAVGAARCAGRSVRRVEDARLLTGAGTFTVDVIRPGMLHACFVRAALAGNLGRCTGYQGILAAVRAAASTINQETR